MANCCVGLIKYDLDQSPPPDECLPGNANDIPAHVVFGPNEPVPDPEVWVLLQMVKDFHKEQVFMDSASHKSCKVNCMMYIMESGLQHCLCQSVWVPM